MIAPSLVLALALAAQSSQPADAPALDSPPADSSPAPASQPAMVDDAPAPSSQPAPAATSQPATVDAASPADDDTSAALRLKEDVLPWTAFASGLALGLSGTLVALVGAWPVLSMLRAQAILADADARGFQEGDQSLVALRTAEIYDRNLTFQQVGAPLLGVGLGMLACGALLAAGGLYTGVRFTVDE